jgi:hypothetical protein
LIGRVARAVEQGLSRLNAFAQGDANALKDSDNELAIKSLSDAVATGRWNSIESKYS